MLVPYVRTLLCAQPSRKICCCCCCLQIPVMNLLLSFHRALIRMLPSLLLDRLSRTLLRTGPTTGITLFVEKTALGDYQTGRCCPRQTDHPMQPIPQLGPNPDNTSPHISPNATPKQARRDASNFKFHRMTLGEATIKEPLTIATGLVNTFTNFVKDIHVHHRPQDSPAGDIRLEPVDNNQNICGQIDLNTPLEGGSDEDFQVRMFVCMYIFAAVCYSTCLCVSASLYVLQMLYSSILFVRRMPVQIWLTKIYLTQLKLFSRLETPTNILQSSNKRLQ